MKTVAVKLIASFFLLILWPVLCVYIPIVSLKAIWRKPKPKATLWPAPPVTVKPEMPMDIACGNPTQVKTDVTAPINWDEIAILYPHKWGRG